MLKKFFITSTQESFKDERRDKDGEVSGHILGRILRILVREYRISPLQIGRQYWNINQAVIFTGKKCGKESNPNVNTEAERASSFSLCRVGHC